MEYETQNRNNKTKTWFLKKISKMWIHTDANKWLNKWGRRDKSMQNSKQLTRILRAPRRSSTAPCAEAWTACSDFFQEYRLGRGGCVCVQRGSLLKTTLARWSRSTSKVKSSDGMYLWYDVKWQVTSVAFPHNSSIILREKSQTNYNKGASDNIPDQYSSKLSR